MFLFVSFEGGGGWGIDEVMKNNSVINSNSHFPPNHQSVLHVFLEPPLNRVDKCIANKYILYY